MERLGKVMKRRKPRTSSVVNSANDRARKESVGAAATGKVETGAGAAAASVPKRSREPRRQRKGLRHFAVRVSSKVESKRVTTYTEVADELVREEGAQGTIDEKNVRRRVYDSLNVLIALGIIDKDRTRKTIRWRGRSHESQTAVNERRAIIARKRAFLAGTREQAAALTALIRRNAANGEENAGLSPPFLVVGTAPDTSIDCVLDEDGREVQFTLSNDFTIFDDREVLRRIPLPSSNGAPSFAVAARLDETLLPSSPRSHTSTPRRSSAAAAVVAASSMFQSPGSFSSTPRRSTPAPFLSPRSFSSLPIFSPRHTGGTGSFSSTPSKALFDLCRDSTSSSSHPRASTLHTVGNPSNTSTPPIAPSTTSSTSQKT